MSFQLPPPFGDKNKKDDKKDGKKKKDDITDILKNFPKQIVWNAGISDLECVEYYDVPTSKPIQSVPANPPKHISTVDIVFMVFAIVIASIFIYMMIVIFRTS